MNCYSFLLLLFLPLSGVCQTQFVKFLKHKSKLQIEEDCLFLSLAFEVTRGYHIQANKPLDDRFIPTKIVINKRKYAEITQINFPTPHLMRIGKNDQLLVLDGSFELFVQLKFDPCFPPGNAKFTGILSYQACDDRKCFFPRELAFEI